MRRYAASKAEIAASESIDPTELDTLANHANKYIRTRVARNAATQAPTLARLSTDTDPYVRSAVAAHPHTSVETLAEMSDASDPDSYVRRALAANPHTPAAALAPATSDDYFTRKSLAGNPSADPDVLRTLAADRDTTIVEKVATNPATPEDVILALIAHHSESVAHALARRNLDPNPTQWRTISVHKQVGRRFENVTKRIPIEQGGRFSRTLIEAMTASPHRSLLLLAASQPDAPHEVLGALAVHEDMWVRARVAENAGTPPALVVQMAHHEAEARLLPMLAARPDLPDEAIVAIAVRNVPTAHHALPERAVEVLLADADPHVRRRAAFVLNVAAHGQPSPAWERMLADEEMEVRKAAAGLCPISVLLAHAGHGCRHVRMAVADRAADPDVLAELASDPEVTVRRRVVKNKACPSEAMAALASDADKQVRTHAAARFMDAMTRTLGL